MTIRVLAGAALALGGSVAAGATTTVPFASDVSQHHPAKFDGTATYDSSAHTLTLVVTNETDPTTGGRLTAFAFDAGGHSAIYQDPDGGHKPNTNGYDELRNRRGIIHTPMGVYHAGAALNGNWGATHGMTHAIAAGTSQTFLFDVTGSNASSMTVGDLFGSGKSGMEIVAAFHGLKHHRSDRAGGVMSSAVTTVDLADNGTTNPPGGGGFQLPPPVNPPSNNGNGETGNSGGTTGTTAVPLPPAAWTGLWTLLLAGAGTIRLRCRRAIN